MIPRTETAVGTIDGVNTSFSATAAYTSGTLSVYLNGQLKRPDLDDGFIESNPSTGAFTMKEPPLSGDVLQVRYLDTSAPQPGEEVQGFVAVIIDLEEMVAVVSDVDVMRAQFGDQDNMSGTLADVDPLSSTVIDVEAMSGTVNDPDVVRCGCS